MMKLIKHKKLKMIVTLIRNKVKLKGISNTVITRPEVSEADPKRN